MKQTVSKVVAVALALLLVMGMASVATAAQVLYVNQAVNVRTGPGLNYLTLGWLDKGDSVQVIGNAVNGWTPIQYSTYEQGYVKNTYLSTAASNSYGYSYNYSCAPYYTAVSGKVTPKVCEDCGAIYKTTSKLNIRSGPGTGYSVLGVLSKGQQVTRVGQSGKWYKILTNEGADAYVSSSYLKAVSAVTTTYNAPVYSYEPGRTYNNPCAVTTTSKLYATTALRVRSGPGTNYSIIGGLQRGEGVTYRGSDGSWYQITTSNGLTGYAHSKYLTGSAPVVRYSSTPVRSYVSSNGSYNNCNTCGTYYYGNSCNSCYGYNGYSNNSVYSQRCTPVFSDYREPEASLGNVKTTAAITVKLEKRASPTTVNVGVDEITIPIGTTVEIWRVQGTLADYICNIRYTDVDKSTWTALDVPKASLGR